MDDSREDALMMTAIHNVFLTRDYLTIIRTQRFSSPFTLISVHSLAHALVLALLTQPVFVSGITPVATHRA